MSLLFLLFIVAVPVFAQTTTDITGLEKLEGTGLSSVDPRVTVGRVIQAFLGLLGVVAIALFIYAGFLWMTSRENEETVAKAKKLLLNAVIGLGIILGAFAITTFIMSKLLEGTGLGGGDVSGPGDGGGGGGRLPRDAFTVRSIQPNTPVGGTPTIRNAVVRLFFTKAVDGTTVDGNITVVKVTKAQDGATIETRVQGTFETKENVVAFTPDAACAEAGKPNADRKCFDESSDHRVTAKVGFVKSTVTDGAGKQLVLLCGTGGACKATFTTGTVVDTQSPTIEISNPFNDQYLPDATSVPIDFYARDDGGIAYVDILVDNVIIETVAPVGATPLEWSSGINWNTGSVTTPLHTIKARVVDIDTNTPGESPVVTVHLRAAHCFNKEKDATETGVDCGGVDCGACNGDSCDGNADCASGACDMAKNQCVEYPIITRVTPSDGAKGNLITIMGRGFGALQGGGKVEFLNKDGAKIADFPQACGASDLWRNDRIIVAIPDGVSAEGVPIKVTNADTFWDDTKNDRGQKYTFTPSSTVRPGLCRVTPEEGTFGTLVTLRGVNFTATKGAVRIGNEVVKSDLVWEYTVISGAAVPNLETGNIDVAVETTKAQGGEQSNPLLFRLKEPVGLPRIETIDPLDGRPGTYVTIRGSNFGTTPAKVYFINEQGGETIAPPNFPEACMVAYWTPTTITVPVPGIADGTYDIVVERENRDNRSNNKPFAVKQNRTERPGVCRLEPDNGPEGLSVTVLGDRLQPEAGKQGKVAFLGSDAAADDKAAILKKWEYQSVQVQVPLLAKTGKVQLTDSSGTTSNTLPFTVQDCRQWGCADARECCGNGVCQERGTCTEGAPACTFNWKFSTGAGGGGGIDDDCTKDSDCAGGLSCDFVTKTCQDTLPHVVEQEECKSAISDDRKDNVQSPSPYRESIDACTNAQLAARFTMNMNDGSLQNTGNVTLVKCNVGERLKPAECTTRVGTSFLAWIGHDTNGEGALYKPAGGFTENTWYRVTLNGEKGGATSVNGKLLDGDRDGKEGGNYEWTFHTKKGTCALDHVRVTPRRATINDPTMRQDYTGVPTAENCNVLDPTSYTWAWDSLDESKAEVVPKLPGPLTNAIPRGETGDTPVKIEGAIGEKKDWGDLTIYYPAPSVVSYWPNCNEACGNTEIGAEFSSPIRVNNVLMLLKCATADCPVSTATRLEFSGAGAADKLTQLLMPKNPSLLPSGTTLRVVFPATSIRGLNGKALTDLNFDSDGNTTLDAFSWTFKTKVGATCRINSAAVAPKAFTAYLTNTAYPYVGIARGSPDACDQEGQRLNALTYNWQWITDQPTLVRITHRDVLPQDAPDGRNDPLQDVSGKTEQRNTAIVADAEGKSGQGTFTLQCGYTNDVECSTLPPPQGRLCPLDAGKPTACGVGSDTCCGARPKVTGGPSSDICSNGVLTTLFNHNMDVSTFSGNIVLTEGAAPCPLQGNCLGAVRGSVDGVNIGGQGFGSFTPEANLKLDTTYTLQIVGDLFGGQADTAKIRNKEGVALAGQKLFTFKTKTAPCPIDAVRIQIGRNGDPPKQEDEDIFMCAGRDTCGDDSELGKPGNQHTYVAEAIAEDGQTLKATYVWQPVEGDDILMVEAVKGVATATPKPMNGTADVTVLASDPTAGSASRTVTVTNFICENSWPTLATFPWRESVTDFSLSYCRDAGAPGRGDDLPEMQYPPVDVKNSPMKKDLLLPVLQER